MTLFASSSVVVDEVKRDRLIVVARNYFPSIELGDKYIYKKVLSAEKEVERRLRVYLEPVKILPQGGTQEERDALDASNTRWIEAPAYDLEAHYFAGDTWGFIPLRERPIISIESIKFVYPAPYSSIFDVPADWIRIDKQYGHLRLVPSSQAALAPLNMFVMQAISGGRLYPEFIHIRYTAGLSNVSREHSDIIDLIYKMAVMKIIDDLYLPQSVSESIDGMSQTSSLDMSKFAEKIDDKIEVLRQSLHGIRMAIA